jgi:hypothetical protein
MALTKIPFYPPQGAAQFLRLPDRFLVAISRTCPYSDFVYKVLIAPLSANAREVGLLAVESIQGYRRFTESEADPLMDKIDAEYSEAELDLWNRCPISRVWPDGKKLCVDAKWQRQKVFDVTLPLSASVEEIGKAILAGFEAIDRKFLPGSKREK